MAKTQSVATVLPGDIIQITERGPLFLAYLEVEECRRTFTRARLQAVRPDRTVEWSEVRVPPGAYEKVGTARMIEERLAKAREAMIKTLAQQREEGGT